MRIPMERLRLEAPSSTSLPTIWSETVAPSEDVAIIDSNEIGTDEPTMDLTLDESLLNTTYGSETMIPTGEATFVSSFEETVYPSTEEPTMDVTAYLTSAGSSQVFLSDAQCSLESPCGLCQGDCDFNDECQEGLTCFRRVGITDESLPAPGCSGQPDVAKGTYIRLGFAYCISHVFSLLHQTDVSSSHFMSSILLDYCVLLPDNYLRLRDIQCTEEYLCEACEGVSFVCLLGA